MQLGRRAAAFDLAAAVMFKAGRRPAPPAIFLAELMMELER